MSDNFHIWYIALSCWQEEPYCFWQRSEVIWGHQRSKTKNLVIVISQGRNGRQFSYLIYGFVMLRERTLLFLVEVRGHLRSQEVKLWKWLVIAISQDSNDQNFSYLIYRFVMMRGRLERQGLFPLPYPVGSFAPSLMACNRDIWR